MHEFISVVAGFPTFLFSAALVVVVGFWFLVLCGVADADGFDADADFDAAGMGGVPITTAVSLLTVTAWFTSLTGSVLLNRTGTGGLTHSALAAVVLLGSLLIAWRVTRLLVRAIVKLFPDERVPSRQDFIGLTCVIRTGRVDEGFGQAEVAARDGSTAVVQVRQAPRKGEDSLAAGSNALLYAYDDAGEFFWVAPFDTALDPRSTSA